MNALKDEEGGGRSRAVVTQRMGQIINLLHAVQGTNNDYSLSCLLPPCERWAAAETSDNSSDGCPRYKRGRTANLYLCPFRIMLCALE